MDNKAYLKLAREIAKQAGKIMVKNFSTTTPIEWKDDQTPVTIADREINDLVIELISKNYPNHSILGEEKSVERKSEYVWVCDPIDGTYPFSHGFPISMFSLALTCNGESILGVIYDPYLDRLLEAIKGEGALLNGEKISVSQDDSFNTKAAVDIETWTASKYFLKDAMNLINEMDSFVSTIRSVVYAGMLVAMGQYAGMIFTGITPWDAAALKIIIEESGGKVTDLYGKDQRYDKPIKGCVVTNGKLHDKLIELIKPLLPVEN